MRIAWLVLMMLIAQTAAAMFAGRGRSAIDVPILRASANQAATEVAQGKEHPEHPAVEEGSASKEHPEHPVAKRKPVTVESVAEYLEGYVAKKAAEEGGWMKVPDEEKGETLELKLDKIHRDRLAKTAEKTYFVCADFKTPEGKAYDLDFWVKETDQGLEVTETAVHKEEGKPRYTWVEKDGIWSHKPVSE